jgi:hypothetical protein
MIFSFLMGFPSYRRVYPCIHVYIYIIYIYYIYIPMSTGITMTITCANHGHNLI